MRGVETMSLEGLRSMTNEQTQEVREKLLHGKAVSRDEFLAALSDSGMQEAIAQIAAVHDLFGPQLEDPSVAAPDVPFSWDELVRFVDGQLEAPRAGEVEAYLGEHYPAMLDALRNRPNN